jgi:hypothetical protein
MEAIRLQISYQLEPPDTDLVQTQMRKISDAEKKRYEEGDRLLAGYKAHIKEWFKSTVDECVRPDEMMRMLRYIKDMPPAAERDFISRLAGLRWLLDSEPDVRLVVLRVIAKRVDKLYGELDDPLPPKTNMFFEAKRILAVR